MKKLMKLSAIALLACAVIYSCKKKDEPAPVAATTTSGTTTTTTGTTTSGTTSGSTTSTTPNKTPMLIGKNWVMTAGVITPTLIGVNPLTKEKVEISNLFAISDPIVDAISICFKDDTLKLTASNTANPNGDYTRKVVTACNGEKDDSGTWKLNTDQTQIIFTSKTGTETTNKILELTSTTLRVETPFTNPLNAIDSKIYTATITLTAK